MKMSINFNKKPPRFLGRLYDVEDEFVSIHIAESADLGQFDPQEYGLGTKLLGEMRYDMFFSMSLFIQLTCSTQINRLSLCYLVNDTTR